MKFKITIYENDYFFLVWKPHWIPTSFWKNKSFLDILYESLDFIKGINKSFYYHLKQFWKDEEFLLLNRLDNDTWWLLYFAKNRDVFNRFKILQADWKIEKIYLVDVFGYVKTPLNINFPIMHHKYLKEKMVVIKKERDLSKWRGRLHNVVTKFIPLYFDDKKRYTTGYAIITKWIRHQIRVHLASIWHPVVWDNIYSKNREDKILHLRSIWLKI